MSRSGSAHSRFTIDCSIDARSDDTSTEFKYSARKVYSRYKWESNYEYLMTTLASIMGVRFIFTIPLATDKTDPTIIHFVVVYLLAGLPLFYMQVVMGQYTQLGVSVFKYLAPIGHGIGYTMLLNALLRCTYYGVLMADFAMFFITSVRAELQWMVCPEGSEDYCWGLNDMKYCNSNCINENTEPSSFLFYKDLYLGGANTNKSHISLGTPILPRVVTLALSWFTVYIVLMLGIQRYKKIILYNLYTIIICMLILFLLCLIPLGAVDGLMYVFHTNPASLTNLGTWAKAVYDTLEVFAFGTTVQVIYGSYMTPKMSSDLLAIFVVLFSLLGTIICAMITQATIGFIAAKAVISLSRGKLIWKGGTWTFFTVMPQGLGFLGAPQLWSMMYFSVCLLMLINVIVTQMDSVQRCIIDAHPQFRNYRSYIIAALCLTGNISGVFFLSKEAFSMQEELFRNIIHDTEAFSILAMCIMVFWIYRVQRFSDDIHFLFGSQPTRFWKICWYLMPVVVAVANIYYSTLPAKGDTIFHTVMFFLIVLPIPGVAISETCNYLRRHSLVGLLQPEERWGPPDPQERHLRHMFNPREEIRSRRRNDACKHKCFTESKVLKKAVDTENMTASEIFDASELVASDTTLE